MCRLKTRARKDKEVRVSSPPPTTPLELPSELSQPLSSSAPDMTRPSSLPILPANTPLHPAGWHSCSYCRHAVFSNGCATLLSRQPPGLLTASLPALGTHKLFTHEQILCRYEPAFRSHDQPTPKSHPLLQVYCSTIVGPQVGRQVGD